MDLADGVTKAGQYIYRAAGTDVAVTDGGTGISTVPTDGTLLIGSTGVGYVSASLSAGSNITITPGAGSISIAAASQAMTWSPKTAAWNIAVNNGYLVSGGTQWVGTLPASAAQGSLFRVAATGALGFIIAQNAGQSIVFGSLTTTPGVGGSIASTAIGDSIEIICTVANTTFLVLSSVGSFNVV
jgi:hypothetical protein